jgi:hypothetical protein
MGLELAPPAYTTLKMYGVFFFLSVNFTLMNSKVHCTGSLLNGKYAYSMSRSCQCGKMLKEGCVLWWYGWALELVIAIANPHRGGSPMSFRLIGRCIAVRT